MSLSKRPTLRQVFAGTLLGLVAFLAVLLYVLLDGTKQSIDGASELFRIQVASEVGAGIGTFLGSAEKTVANIERQIQRGLLNPKNPAELEKSIFSELLSDGNLAEITLTQGVSTGFSDDGTLKLDPSGKAQMSICRVREDGQDLIVRSTVAPAGDSFARTTYATAEAAPYQSLASGSSGAAGKTDPNVNDPTRNLTFITPSRKQFSGQTLWSDLHWPERAEKLPVEQRRAVVTVQKAIVDASNNFAGVVRVGLWTEQLDRIAKIKAGSAETSAAHRIYICDKSGRLVTRVHPDDRFQEFGDDIRVAAHDLPVELERALKSPELGALDSDKPVSSSRFDVNGRTFVNTFSLLPGSQDWVAGILVPEDVYLGALNASRNRLIGIASLLMLSVLVLGLLTLRLVKSGLDSILHETARMQQFDFAASARESYLLDLQTILYGLEQAKTTVRAMSKYVPVEIVRQVYNTRTEPRLGGELRELTLLFSDIKDFTTLSESLKPDELAAALGLYLREMTAAVHRHRGTVDKFIGDSVMALWNAPLPVESHSKQACRAALDCVRALRDLFASDQWGGRPPIETRFGIHKDSVFVGNFGSPERMNYTALGDGVNIASRLEGLNKQYGTSILVSENVYREAKDEFYFRYLDKVALKGKHKAINVYELLGVRDSMPASAAIACYEQALAHYFGREFQSALSILNTQLTDAPSAVLANRCRQYLAHPPTADWDGLYAAEK